MRFDTGVHPNSILIANEVYKIKLPPKIGGAADADFLNQHFK